MEQEGGLLEAGTGHRVSQVLVAVVAESSMEKEGRRLGRTVGPATPELGSNHDILRDPKSAQIDGREPARITAQMERDLPRRLGVVHTEQRPRLAIELGGQ